MNSGGFRLDLLLEIAQLARSTYYYQLKQLGLEDKNQDIKNQIQLIFREHRGNYGYRRITLELRNRGFLVNHKKVQRLMTEMGLAARIRRSVGIHLIKAKSVRKPITSSNVSLKALSLMKNAIHM